MKQKRARQQGSPPEIQVTTRQNTVKTIKSGKYTVLLGVTLQQNTTWQAHLDTGEDPLIPKLRKTLGGIKYIGKFLSEKGKLMLMNGLVISRLTYLIPMWRGTNDKFLSKIQAVQNNAARFISGKHRRTKTKELMEHCKWLNVKEMSELYTLVAIFRIVKMGIPYYFSTKINMDQDNIIFSTKPRLQNTAANFIWRGIRLREINKISHFPMGMDMYSTVHVVSK